ncbi:MAG: 50S ribosomal protein L7ae-like protein [Firmicutes bacterium]|nr:50S ribosomal protein L7ae-like protein [Bacillota bacterium]
MEHAFLEAKEKVVGLKETLRAVQKDKVSIVYLANDVDESLQRRIKAALEGKNVKMVTARIGRKEFGRLCGIEVGASVVALLREGGGNDADNQPTSQKKPEKS